MCKYLVKKVWRDIIFIVSTQTKVELEHKVWLCLYQLKKKRKKRKHRRKCHLFNCLDSTLEAIYLVRVYVYMWV